MSIKEDVQGFDISENSAVIIGCGGLGTNVAVHLAGAGIGRLLLMDFDTVEQRNLNRQFFYTESDIGKDKSALLARRLKAYAPACDIDYVTEKINTPDFEGNYDVIVLAVDNIETRRRVNAYCKESKTPCVNGSINGFFGTAYLYLPDKTPDLEAAGCLNESDHTMLSPSVTAGIIGALEAKLAVDCFIGNTDSGGRLYIYDNNEIHSLKIRSEESD